MLLVLLLSGRQISISKETLFGPVLILILLAAILKQWLKFA